MNIPLLLQDAILGPKEVLLLRFGTTGTGKLTHKRQRCALTRGLLTSITVINIRPLQRNFRDRDLHASRRSLVFCLSILKAPVAFTKWVVGT